tara:strand:+ start:107 stop:436 length:330 start_codon:yes stop_codon:yes gene_type:complete
MADVIRLVQGDQKPDITLQLTDNMSGNSVDLSAATTSILVYFRAAGTTTVLSTITCTKTDAVNGIISFDFAPDVLDVAAGMYEGEVEIDFNGDIQSPYDLLKFRVRAQF